MTKHAFVTVDKAPVMVEQFTVDVSIQAAELSYKDGPSLLQAIKERATLELVRQLMQRGFVHINSDHMPYVNRATDTVSIKLQLYVGREISI